MLLFDAKVILKNALILKYFWIVTFFSFLVMPGGQKVSCGIYNQNDDSNFARQQTSSSESRQMQSIEWRHYSDDLLVYLLCGFTTYVISLYYFCFFFQELLLSSGGYQKLFEAMKSLGQPTKLMIDSLICLSQSRDQDIGDEHEAMVRIVEPIAHLVDWLPDITDPELQYDTASAINQICSFSLQRHLIVSFLKLYFKY